MSGRFITFEGGEGVGKSTQAGLLAQWLRGKGIDVVETREPGGTPGGDAIRGLLLGTSVVFGAIAEAYLFAAARAEHVRQLIEPALASGKWVVCDRFADSSLAYQGAAGGLGMDRVAAINAPALGECAPDLTILLTLAVGDAAARAELRDGDARDRFSARDASYHETVEAAFQRIVQDNPERVVSVAADRDIAGVAADIATIVEDRLL